MARPETQSRNERGGEGAKLTVCENGRPDAFFFKVAFFPMPPSTIAQLIISFLGGGLVSAIGNWLHANRAARREREMSLIQEQLRMLYGPLSFFTSQNEQLFKLSGSVQAEFNEFFTGRWSDNETVQGNLEQSGEATTALSNAYIARVVENNTRVMALLENNWHLADLDDLGVFSRFQVDYTRYLHEVKQQGRKNVPLTIVMKLGTIAFMRPDMIASVQATFRKKQDRLTQLRSTAIPVLVFDRTIQNGHRV